MKSVAWKALGALAAAAASLLSSSASADGPPAAGRTLAKADLKPMLEGLGYEMKDLGDSMYQVWVERPGTLKYFMKLSLSENGAFLWLSAPVGDVPAPESFPADRLVDVLAENARLGPAHFEVSGINLRLVRPIANRAVTPALLRREIEALGDLIREEEKFWDVSQWAPKPPAPPPADAAMGAGR